MVTRPLTDREQGLLEGFYRGYLDTSAIRVTDVAILPGQGRNSVTPFNTIHLSNTFELNNDLDLAVVAPSHLVHEAWHAYEWQKQGIFTVAVSVAEQIGHQLGLWDAYDLNGVTVNTNFDSLWNEQQARMMEARYLYWQGLSQAAITYAVGGYIPNRDVVEAVTERVFYFDDQKSIQSVNINIGLRGDAISSVAETKAAAALWHGDYYSLDRYNSLTKDGIDGDVARGLSQVINGLKPVENPDWTTGRYYDPATGQHYGYATVSSAYSSYENSNQTVGEWAGGIADAIGGALESVGEAISDAFESLFGGSDPIILDLDGDGIEVNLSYQAAYDFDGDGYRERTAWAGADDGFLVIDLNADGSRGRGDGKIDQQKELALAAWGPAGSTDLQALAEAKDAQGRRLFDTNGDGALTAADASFGEFRVWQDKDQDGETDDGELMTLSEAGITRINLTYDDKSAFSQSADDVDVGLATLRGSASFVRNGKTIKGGVGDMALSFQEGGGWRRVETATGYRIEFENGGSASHRQLQVNETNFHLGNLQTDWVSAAGNARNNVIDGSGKADAVFLDGDAGNDTLRGGFGDDVLVGGDGRDAMHGGAGNDVIYADAADLFWSGSALITGGEGYDLLVLTADATFSTGTLDAYGFEAVIASDKANTLTGARDDVDYNLDGRGGNDVLTTAGGNDILSGGDGNDRLTGNDGADRLMGGAGNDVLLGGDGDDVLAGGTGTDSLRGGAGDDIYFYARGDGSDDILDYAVGTYEERYAYYESVKHGAGKNAKYVNELRTGYRTRTGEIDGGIDTLQFGAGIAVSDLLVARSGGNLVVRLRDDANANAVEAGDQVTVLEWADQRNRIENFAFLDGTKLDMSEVTQGRYGMGGNDVLTGTAEGDFLSGGNGDDALSGNGGRDILSGGDGTDTLNGGDGKDVLYGDAGNDVAGGGTGDDYLIGGDGADTLRGDAGDDALSGDDGNDRLEGGDGDDYLLGGAGNDTLLGGAGDDTYFYFRGDGKDLIYDHATEQETYQQKTGRMIYQRSGKSGQWVAETRTAVRTVQRDGGDDTLQFGFSIGIDDLYVANSGANLVVALRDADKASSGPSALEDVVTIQNWSNAMNRIERFVLGDGLTLDMSETLYARSGLAGDDALGGTAGNDFLSGGGGNDTLTGLAGDDALAGGDGNDRLDGGAGDDDLFGGAGDDMLLGGAGVDYLIGGAGKDTLDGGAGNDVLTGGRGDDTLKGGAGDDVYVFNRGDGKDVIDESAWQTVAESYTYETGRKVQQRVGGGKSATTVWVNEVRTGARKISKAVDGGDDTLQLGAYIDVSDLIVNTSGSNLAIELAPLLDGGAIEDSVTVKGWNQAEFRVETLRFQNDFVVEIGDIAYAKTGGAGAETIAAVGGAASWLGGGAGNDTLNGSAKADILMGGAGNDTVNGGAGDDVYIFSRGDGKDTLTDSGSSAVGSDRENPGGDKLLLGAGISIEDLVLQRVGADMRIYVGDKADMATPLAQIDDVVTVKNWASGGSRIELLQFYDGMDFDVSAVTNTYLGQDRLSGGWGDGKNERRVADVNGDGRADIVGFGQTATYVALGLADGKFAPASEGSSAFDASSGWGDGKYERVLADVNGDGRADIVGFGAAATYVALGQADGSFAGAFSATAAFGANGSWGDGKFERVVADVNGDGRADIVGFGAAATYVALGQANGRFGSAFSATTAFGANSSWGDGKYERVVADVNGDGRADIVGFGAAATYVALGQANGTFGGAFSATAAFGANSGWGDARYDRRVADVNGDGRADIVGFGAAATYVALGQANGKFGGAFSATTGFGANSGWGGEAMERVVADVNGDGRADIVGFGATATYVALGQANGKFGGTFSAIEDFSAANRPEGTDVNDTLNGSNAADWIDGFAGNDVLRGNGGDDYIFGRIGNDQIDGGAGDDVISGGEGNDRISGGAGDDIVSAGDGNDTLNGDAGADGLFGGAGDDVINGGAGDDVIVGDKGDDTYIASAGNDVYRFGFGDGHDTYRGSDAAGVFATDVFIFEDDVRTEHLWFERVDNDLWVRLLGSDDRIEFENWFWSNEAKRPVFGFQAGDEFLKYDRVQTLINAMKAHTPNDGETAYGVTADDLPTVVASAVASVWEQVA